MTKDNTKHKSKYVKGVERHWVVVDLSVSPKTLLASLSLASQQFQACLIEKISKSILKSFVHVLCNHCTAWSLVCPAANASASRELALPHFRDKKNESPLRPQLPPPPHVVVVGNATDVELFWELQLKRASGVSVFKVRADSHNNTSRSFTEISISPPKETHRDKYIYIYILSDWLCTLVQISGGNCV